MLGQISIIASNIYSIFAKLATVCLLALMPFYLFFIYIKIDNVDALSYLLVMTMIFILYLPIQIIANEKNIPINFHMIYEDDDILKIVTNSLFVVLSIIVMKFDSQIGMSILYISWLILQIQLFNIFKMANMLNKIKMIFVFILIIMVISYNFFSFFSDFTISFNVETFVLFFYILFQFLIVMAVLFPLPTLLAFFKMLSMFFNKSANTHGTINVTANGFFTLLSFGFIFYLLMIHIMNSFISSLNPNDIAFYSVYGFIVLSALGAYFQFKLFWSYFLNETLSWSATLISLCFFIGILIVIVNTKELVEKRSELIIDSQQKFNTFYQKHLN